MKLLTNNHGRYVTGTAIADAVMTYGLALARRRELDIVEIPFIAEDGDPARVQITVGWLMDYSSRTMTSTLDELTETDTIDALTAKTASLNHSKTGGGFTADEISDLGWDDEGMPTTT